jgi:hypothetical protein
MRKLSLALAAAVGAAFFAAPASATVINFVAEANSGGERGLQDGAILNTAALGGLSLQFDAGIGGKDRDFAYLNQKNHGHEAGLGVCTRLGTGNKCAPNRDDSLSSNEFVQVSFLSGPFDIRKMSFNSETGSLAGSSGLLQIATSIGGVATLAIMTFAQASTYNFGPVDWIAFGFVDTEFFVARISDVPIPGALPLLLSGLAGLGFAAKRKKKQA